MSSRALLALFCALLLLSCRREEEDLSAAIDKRPGNCSEQRSDDARGDQPPEVVLSLDGEFLNAVESGNVDDVKEMLEGAKVSPFVRNSEGRTALILAVLVNQLPMVEYLLTAVPVLAPMRDKNDKTAEDYVLASEDLQDSQKEALLKLLRGEQLSQEELDAELLSIVQDGFKSQSLDRMKTLLEQGASPDVQDLTSPENPIPALFLALGIRIRLNGEKASLSQGGSPVYEYAAALIAAGANKDLAILLKGKTYTPAEFVRESKRFDDSRAQWESLFGP